MLERLVSRLTDRDRNDEGFTLIELLVVITILGILAAVVVFSVAGIGDKGQDSACKTDTATIRTAQEAYYAKKGSYAPSAAALFSAGFLSSDSKMHATAPTNDGKYSVTSLAGANGIATCTDVPAA